MRFFKHLVLNLISNEVAATFPEPKGKPRLDVPGWAKPSHPISGQTRTPGCKYFKGDPAYEEKTPRQIYAYHDFLITPEDLRDRSASIREGIDCYISPGTFGSWLGAFVSNLERRANQNAVKMSLNNIYEQFNALEPSNLSYPEDKVRYQLIHGDPNTCRVYLTLSDTRYRAHRYPELVLALGLYQGAHRPFLNALKSTFKMSWIYELPETSEDEVGNMELLFDGPFQTFNTFIVYNTLLPLIILQRDEVVKEGGSGSDLAITSQAISRAWEILFKKRLLRHDFPGNGRMICPANKHLRYAKDAQLIEKLYSFILDNRHTPIIEKLCDFSRKAALSAVLYPEHHYLATKTKAVAGERRHARGGKGLELA